MAVLKGGGVDKKDQFSFVCPDHLWCLYAHPPMLLPYPLHWNLMTLTLLAFKCFRKLSLLSLLTLLCLVRLLTVSSFSKTCFTFSVKALPLLEPCILDWSLFCPRIFALFFLNLWVVSFSGADCHVDFHGITWSAVLVLTPDVCRCSSLLSCVNLTWS